MDEMNINNTPENNQDSQLADGNDGIQVVSAAAESKKKNIIPIIVIAVVLVLAAICAIVFFASKKPKTPDIEPTSESYDYDIDNVVNQLIIDSENATYVDENGSEISRETYIESIKQQVAEATTTLNADVGRTSPLVIEEDTTKKIDTNNSTEGEKETKAKAQIKAFLDRQCYLSGALYGGNEGNPITMSFDGDNYEVLTNLEGTEVAIMNLDGKMYIKRTATKQYLELTEPVMELMGISKDDFGFDFGGASFADYEKAFKGTYGVKIDGKDAMCHEYNNNGKVIKFYSVGGELREISLPVSDGSSSQIVINHFSEAIPAGQLTLKGYTAASVSAIFADLM